MNQAAPALIYDNRPDFAARSALTITPGMWRMRNGHTARVDSVWQIEYGPKESPKRFPVWKGRCVECDEGRTWNINGTYAAIGRHDFDILEAL